MALTVSRSHPCAGRDRVVKLRMYGLFSSININMMYLEYISTSPENKSGEESIINFSTASHFPCSYD